MAAIIDYKNVEIYRKELLVLKNVNFSLDEGQFTYLIGRVGSGKKQPDENDVCGNSDRRRRGANF